MLVNADKGSNAARGSGLLAHKEMELSRVLLRLSASPTVDFEPTSEDVCHHKGRGTTKKEEARVYMHVSARRNSLQCLQIKHPKTSSFGIDKQRYVRLCIPLCP